MKILLILFFLLQTFVYICEQIILSQQYQQFKLITMKLNRLLTLPFFMLLLSCSSDWDLQPQSDDFVITVNASSAATSRADESAGVPAIEGYEFKCIMQLLDETGETVGSQSVVSMSSGSASFTITGENIDNGAVKAIFWAEYQPTAGGGKVYDTSNLKNITYKSTTFDLATANSTAVFEAFAGKLDKIEKGASVTLKRPVSKIVFSPKNRENVSDANSIEIKYVTASGYNVLAQTASGTSEITLNKGSFDPQAEGAWFTTFMLCPANKSNAAGDITINLSGDNDYSRAIIIPANSIPADPNHIYNITADISSDDMSNYPEYSDKKIWGYAVALKNISDTPLMATLTGATNMSTGIGYANTEEFLSYLAGSPFESAFKEWRENNKITNPNITKWYIPSYSQKSYFATMYEKLILENILAKEDILYGEKSQYYILSSINSILNLRLAFVEENSSGGLTANDKTGPSKEVYCRPMVTIFTDATTE